MLVLIALILFGVGVTAVAAVLLLRSAPTIKQARNSDRELAESEVYQKLYGKRSLTVSGPLPMEVPPKAELDSPRPQPSDPPPRTHRGSRARDSHT